MADSRTEVNPEIIPRSDTPSPFRLTPAEAALVAESRARDARIYRILAGRACRYQTPAPTPRVGTLYEQLRKAMGGGTTNEQN